MRCGGENMSRGRSRYQKRFIRIQREVIDRVAHQAARNGVNFDSWIEKLLSEHVQDEPDFEGPVVPILVYLKGAKNIRVIKGRYRDSKTGLFLGNPFKKHHTKTCKIWQCQVCKLIGVVDLERGLGL